MERKLQLSFLEVAESFSISLLFHLWNISGYKSNAPYSVALSRPLRNSHSARKLPHRRRESSLLQPLSDPLVRSPVAALSPVPRFALR
jgi:hypothetical protein